MKKLISILIISVLLLMTHTTKAQDDVVDFGDSGIEVVVEQEGGGMKTGWVYWFPDEFFEFVPPKFVMPTLPSLPPWLGGGGGGSNDQGCEDVLQDIVNLSRSIALNEEIQYKWKTDRQIVMDDGRIVAAGSQEYKDMMKNLERTISKLAKKLWAARDRAADAC